MKLILLVCVGKNDIVTKEENLKIHKSESKMIYDYYKYASRFPILTEDQEKILMKQYFEEKNENAGKVIILSHLRLVLKAALQYKNYKISLMTLISEGTIGILYALKKFDSSKGARFGTYADFWIHEKIRNFIIKSWSYVKTGSVAMRKKILFGKKDELNMTQEERELRSYREISLESEYKDVEGGEIVSLMSKISDSVKTPQENALIVEGNVNNNNLVENMLSILNERERYIIYNRYQVDSKKTLEELSQELKISKERVRQIEGEALRKMRKLAQ